MCPKRKYDKDFYDLYNAFRTVKSVDEFYNFMRDLCTVQEIENIAKRFMAAKLLYEGNMTYREIAEKTSIALAKVVRVAKFLNYEKYGGYRKSLLRMLKKTYGRAG